MVKERLAVALMLLGVSGPAIVAQRGGTGPPAPNPAANPPRLPLEQRIAHTDPSRFRSASVVHGGPGRLNPGIGGFYYVMNGEGSATVGQETAPIKSGDAIPIRVGEVTGFENTGTVPLEFLVVGIARDLSKKNDMLATPPQRMGGPGGRGRGQAAARH